MKLVAYFSVSGNSAEKAKLLAEATGAELYEIKPEKPYSNADVKWTNPLARCNKEWLKKAAPALSDKNAEVEKYDEILLVFPIWYWNAPLIIRSFLQSYDFSGKKIVLYATSGGSNFGKTLETIKPFASGAEITEGAILNGINTLEEIKAVSE